MIRFGHIPYSNCWPIHEPFLRPGEPRPWLRITEGSPAGLNALLAAGGIDLAPCSSVELARHPDEYRPLRGLCIGSAGRVESIALVSRAPPRALAGARVALTTASATSRVLARLLLEVREGVVPRWEDFDQETADPLDDSGVAAALFIGDVALRRTGRSGELRLDLGEEWTRWTGLPFVYALWQARGEALREPHLPGMHAAMLGARAELPRAAGRLAGRAATRFGIEAVRLAAYWRRIRYDLDEESLAGLRRFFELAADLGEIPSPPAVRPWG